MIDAAHAEADAADKALMRRIQADDPEAFGVLYDRFSARAYRIASSMAKNGGYAEDMVQEAFVSVWRFRANYDPELGTVAGWVMTYVRHRSIDVLRVQRRHDAQREEADAMGEGRSTAPDSVEARTAERDAAARLRTSLGALPAAQREVIALAYFGELSATEIAARLALPVGTVKGRMRLGLTKLRDGTEF